MSELQAEERPCSFCPNLTRETCRICRRPFCGIHESSIETGYCADCVCDLTIKTEEKPLINKDGDKEDGREIVLTGDFWHSSPRLVSEMSDDELSRFIEQYTIKLHETEQIREYQQIMLGMMNMEKDERRRADLRHKRAERHWGAPKSQIKSSDPIDTMVEKLRKAGITAEMLQGMLEAKVAKK